MLSCMWRRRQMRTKLVEFRIGSKLGLMQLSKGDKYAYRNMYPATCTMLVRALNENLADLRNIRLQKKNETCKKTLV